MKPRVLHLIESAGLYGAEQVILTLAREQLRDAQVEPVIGCIVNTLDEDNTLFNEARAQGISAIKIPLPVARLPIALFKAKKLLRDQSIALIHCHGYKPAVFGFGLAKLIGAPIISSCHNWIIPPGAPFKMRAMIWLELKLYRFFAKVVAVSKPIYETLSSIGIAKNKLALIYNGISLPSKSYSEDREESHKKIRESLDIDENSTVFIQLARLSEVKQQATLIKAFAKLHKDNKKTRLLIAGEGPLRDNLQQLIDELSLSDAVKLLGFRSDSEALLRASDCFCLVSRDEGMPVSLLEACAMYCPVIVTGVGSIPELIVDAGTGRIVPVGDVDALAGAMQLTLDSPDIARHMADKAYQSIESQFSAPTMSARYLSIYRELLPL